MLTPSPRDDEVEWKIQNLSVVRDVVPRHESRATMIGANDWVKSWLYRLARHEAGFVGPADLLEAESLLDLRLVCDECEAALELRVRLTGVDFVLGHCQRLSDWSGR